MSDFYWGGYLSLDGTIELLQGTLAVERQRATEAIALAESAQKDARKSARNEAAMEAKLEKLQDHLQVLRQSIAEVTSRNLTQYDVLRAVDALIATTR
jgi:hypothetical protein